MRLQLQDKYEWHDFFVVLPYTISHVRVWWEVAQRRKVYTGYSIDCCDNGRDYTWEYRLKEKA